MPEPKIRAVTKASQWRCEECGALRRSAQPVERPVYSCHPDARAIAWGRPYRWATHYLIAEAERGSNLSVWVNEVPETMVTGTSRALLGVVLGLLRKWKLGEFREGRLPRVVHLTLFGEKCPNLVNGFCRCNE